jgi:hypothetical protein
MSSPFFLGNSVVAFPVRAYQMDGGIEFSLELSDSSVPTLLNLSYIRTAVVLSMEMTIA